MNRTKEKFLFGDSEPEIIDQPIKKVNNTDLTYNGQISYHFKKEKPISPESDSPDPDGVPPTGNANPNKNTF